jgi:short-subunit dehydrogenase
LNRQAKEPVLILGGRSDIGIAVAHRFAALGHAIQLAARNSDTLQAEKADIELRFGVPVSLHEFDVLEIESHAAFVDALPQLPLIAVCAVGVLGNQSASEQNPAVAKEIMRSNYEGPALILAALAEKFESRGRGTLVGISSVAGDRGRSSNYVYGSAKAGFSAFLSGLRSRLSQTGVHVVTVLPGFVATRMTADLRLPNWLTAQPQEVAAVIETAVRKHRDIIYSRPIWRLIMLAIRHTPETIFKRLKI